jgi:hypothetical protein
LNFNEFPNHQKHPIVSGQLYSSLHYGSTLSSLPDAVNMAILTPVSHLDHQMAICNNLLAWNLAFTEDCLHIAPKSIEWSDRSLAIQKMINMNLLVAFSISDSEGATEQQSTLCGSLGTTRISYLCKHFYARHNCPISYSIHLQSLLACHHVQQVVPRGQCAACRSAWKIEVYASQLPTPHPVSMQRSYPQRLVVI